MRKQFAIYASLLLFGCTGAQQASLNDKLDSLKGKAESTKAAASEKADSLKSDAEAKKDSADEDAAAQKAAACEEAKAKDSSVSCE